MPKRYKRKNKIKRILITTIMLIVAIVILIYIYIIHTKILKYINQIMKHKKQYPQSMNKLWKMQWKIIKQCQIFWKKQ